MTNPQPGELLWAEVPDPVPGPGEILIDVAASAVNRADLLQVAGHYPPPKGAPAWPGLECSGRAAGREVCALLSGGGYAEQVAVPEGQVLPLPGGVSLTEAAALPEVACTVWSNLTMTASLTEGETVLIHGGGSGIGTFAIQYAKAVGAHVVATARSEKHPVLRELGADEVLDYRTDDFSQVRADVVLDIMGAAYLSKNVAALKPDGRIVVIGLQGGRVGELDLGALLAKRGSIFGTTLRSRAAQAKAEIVAGVARDVWPLIEAGKIRPVIDRAFPMTEVAAAHALVASNAHVGKVLLTVP